MRWKDYFSTWRIRQVENLSRLIYSDMPKKPLITEADQQIKTSIGVHIRLACAHGGKKPVEVAQVAGVSLAHQYRIEAGERTPDALYLIKVARHLGISLDDLCGLASEAAPIGSKGMQLTQSNNQGGVNIQVGHQHGQIHTGDNNEKRAARRAKPIK